MKALLLMISICLALGLSANADCVKNSRGKTVCSDGKNAAVVNPNTGNVKVAEKDRNGVTTTETRNGGSAKSKNGTTVAQGQNGTCAKTKNNNTRCKAN